jgi:hypothetical protein
MTMPQNRNSLGTLMIVEDEAMVALEAPSYFSTKRIRAGDVLPHQQLHLKAALARKCRGAGSYHPETGWVIEPI